MKWNRIGSHRMGKIDGKNKKIKKLIASKAKSVAIFLGCCVAVSVCCIICKQETQEEEKQLSRESEISKFKEALKETRVRGIVFRVISRDDFSSSKCGRWKRHRSRQ